VRLRSLLFPAALLAALWPVPVAGQTPLSLGQAMARADRQAYSNRIAQAQVAGRSADRDRTLQGLLPTVRAEAGWIRTTDPLNAFGFALRQRTVTQAAFAPDRLNHPSATSNLGTGIVLEQPLINPDLWFARAAATSTADAAHAQARWTASGTRLEVIATYYGGILVREQVAALEAGHAAAQSHVRMAQSLLDQGMVTRSDVLLAEVKAGELEASLAAAQGDLALAIGRFATALGSPDDTTLMLPAALPALDLIRRLHQAPDSARPRADVEAARLGVDAAEGNLRRAKATMLPRINSFARYDWNDPSALAGGQPSWTVGVMASWSFFSGGAELADQRAARAQRDGAVAMAEAAEAGARLDGAARANALAVALVTAGINGRAVAQSAEARRIVARKYEGGLATVTELLEANAIEVRSQLEYAAARYRAILAAAAWRQALGWDLMTMTILDGETK
jgi:outer membrane protein TolC